MDNDDREPAAKDAKDEPAPGEQPLANDQGNAAAPPQVPSWPAPNWQQPPTNQQPPIWGSPNEAPSVTPPASPLGSAAGYGEQATAGANEFTQSSAAGYSSYQSPYDSNASFTPAPPKPKSIGAAKLVAIGLALVLLMVGSGATGALIAQENDDSVSTSTGNTTNTVANAASEPVTQALAKVAAAVQPSVVSIEVSSNGSPIDTGSGVIYKTDGTIVTNNHVISAAATGTNTSIEVKFSNGNTSNAEIVGRDPSTDIAVIKADDAENLTAATLGTSTSLHVGDTVLALGSPLGLDGSVASGIVSALHRTVNLGSDDTNPFGRSRSTTQSTVADAIQTDAAINPGNSGGPLADIEGKVVGINTAIASLGGTSQSGSIGVGFAIPIDEVQSVAEQLIRGETPKHALLGVQISDASTSNNTSGALVQDITIGGAADKAGIKAGDVITKFGDKKVSTADELSAAVRTEDPGDQIVITYERDGSSKTANVTLGSSTD